MGVVRHRRRWYYNHHRLLSAFTFLLFFTTSATALSKLGAGFREREKEERGSGSDPISRVLTQRRLGGPGSSPPTCRSKCGRCFPCMPVHAAIQPGFSMPLQYYPEAWRCKCGNELFMP
ncbi:EPIDERMAL PATTERNING FACTOR-like protein 5 [Tripterygium wilfordii]|uniref:Epidermal patterning factor-like protein n=1 Tax=Tripterygium wilfordii TaxID=458696 RepID=A0A7J7E167_TRIWF|nr:EPIDERMAL PATTERNING FACTOR-like protein 5 isoform X2 [Tripterygium wilfordii]KAF5752327.1 EPIDERMAL PATTERNING FACTOR-like protein 5 [Tripterygium wilfordii]